LAERRKANMKYLCPLFLSAILISLSGCRDTPDYNLMLEKIQKEISDGNLISAIYHSDSLKKLSVKNDRVLRKADSLSQIAERIRIDFPLNEDQINGQIEKRTGPFSPEEKAAWEKKGWLEFRIINGQKMYFKRAASNLILIRKFYEQKETRLQEIASDPEMIFRLKHTEEVYRISDNKTFPVAPVSMKIVYTITVHQDAVPEGDIIRCWLPWPKENHKRQQKVKLISTSCPEYIIGPDSAIHSTIYMETVTKKGLPTIFQVIFSYQSSAQVYNTADLTNLPYDKSSELFIRYTAEQLPQINFSPEIRRLADSIASPGDSPEETVKKTYHWFKENIPWTGALEYSVMPDIPAYVLKNRRGDCGMQTFLFISMLRYKGIPVRWQSGWMVPPGAENLHDWCEVYYEGTGWVPVDISYDLQSSENKAVRDFFLSGIDSYRLIVNDGIGGPLHPEKQYLRSEPYDFQRGEVEWKGGNLYFDKWDYDMKIEYLK
jgi:hypothetical protein